MCEDARFCPWPAKPLHRPSGALGATPNANPSANYSANSQCHIAALGTACAAAPTLSAPGAPAK